MKTLNDYMSMSYRMEVVEDAKKAWLEAALEEGVEIHEPRESVLRISSFEE